MTEHPDLTAKEVAALLRLNVGTVKKLCRDGDLPGAYKTTASPQGNWRIPHAAITAYRTARQTDPNPDPTVAEYARSIGVNRTTIYTWINTGRLAAYHDGARTRITTETTP